MQFGYHGDIVSCRDMSKEDVINNTPTNRDIEELNVFADPHCLTIYLPFTDPLATADQNRIVMKNMLRDAETMLAKVKMTDRDIKKTTKPAYDLLQDKMFWPTKLESLVLYALPDYFRIFSIPDISIPVEIRVKRGFDLQPLKDALAENARYFVLALSHKYTQLYGGDRFKLEAVELDGLPSDMKTALGIDEYPKSLQTHTVAPTSKQNNSEAFHEQYEVSHTDKDMLLEFFRLIDRNLQPILRKDNAPLVIGGVDYLTAMYRKVNTYSNLLAQNISGNLDKTNPDAIRAAAWVIVGG